MASQHQSTCTICLEGIDDMGKASFLPCFHGFHQPCFNEYVTDKIQTKRDICCPVCRIVHFTYGDRNYTYIMNELCHETNKVCARPTAMNSNFIFESSGGHTRRRTETPSGPSVSITIPTLSSVDQTTRQTVKWDPQTVWYKYRYYIVFVIILCVFVFVVLMIIKTTSLAS